MTTTISNQSLGPQTISSDTTYVNDTITASGGYDGVAVSGSTAVVVQGTTITSAQRGLVAYGLLKLSNSGTITSGARVGGVTTFDAVQALSPNAVVLNMGTISAATDSAVSGEGGLAVTNAAGATLAGGSGALFGYAIQFDGGTGSFDNFGIANAQGRGVTVNTNLGVQPGNTGVTITLEAGSMTGALSLSSQDDTVNLYTGAVTTAADTHIDPVSGAAVTVRAAGTYGAASFGAIALGGGTNTLNLHGAGDSTAQHVTANGAAGSIDLNAVTGASVINKLDPGTWTFTTSASGVAAPISLQAGAIQATAAGAFGTGAITASGGSLEYSASGTYANAVALQTTTHFTVDAGLTATLSGAITGTGGAVFDGAGTKVLTNSGTGYTGLTTVSGGILAQDGTGFGSAITVMDGAILWGTGVSTAGVFIYGNAVFAPGEGTGKFTSGTLSSYGTFTSATLSSHGTFVESIAGATTFGQARVTSPYAGAVTLSGSLLLNYTGGAEPYGTVYRIIDNTGTSAVSGTFDGLGEGATLTSNGHLFQISYFGGTGNDVTLTEVNPIVPVFTGLTATTQLVVDNTTIRPFANVKVTDANVGQTQTVTVSFTAANGTLSNLGAAVVSGGVATYTVTGTTAAVSYALESASFTPHLVYQGAPVTTTFTITDSDGLGSTSDSTTTVKAMGINNPPLLSGNFNTMAHNAVSYVEQAAPVVVNGAVTVSDPDTARLVGATVKILPGYGQAGDTLHFTDQNGITGVYNAATFTLTLSGSATTAQYQTALESVTFDNTTNDDPTAGGTVTSRSVSFVVDDGQSINNLSVAAYVTINVTAVNDPPVLAGGGNMVAFAEQGAVVVNPGLTISDPDGPAHLIGATVTISANAQAGDTLNFTNQNGITGVYDATTHVLTLSGSALKSQYRAILDAVTFDNTTRDPTAGGSAATRTISFVVNDGQSDHNLSTAATTTINLAAVSGPLQLAGGGNAAVYTLHTPPVAVNGALTVSDPSSPSLIGATVTISTNAQAGDTLHFANQNGITGVYNATTHVLALSGSATAAQYQAALESVTFDNQTSGATLGARTVSFQADDGQASNGPSSVATTTLSVALPSTQPTPGIDFLTAQVGGDAIHALSGDDTIIGGSGHDSLYGDDGNDVIILNAVTDSSTVYGGLGNDVIDASRSTHSNYLSGDNGDDSIVAGSGADTLLGGDGNDTLIAGSGRDNLSASRFYSINSSTLLGGAGNDVIDASRSTQTNYLGGDNGDDSIRGGLSDDTLLGGDGNDTLIAGSGRDQIFGNAGDDRITIGASTLFSTVYGGKGNDVIDASRSTHANYLSGDVGDDYILAGFSADTLFGGDGNDTLIAGSGQNQFLSGDGGNDLIIIGASTSKTIVFGGEGADTIDASTSTHANFLSGDNGDDSIVAGSSADTLLGGYGNDTLIAGSGQDLIYGGVDSDRIVIGAASQGATVYGGSGSDTIDASASTQANLLYGDGLDDNLYAQFTTGVGGNDSIIGGSGADTFFGGDGNDTLIAGSGQDQIYANAGNDLVTIGGSNLGSTVYGGQGDDVIDASRSTHANYLSGDLGNDSIVAGSGADTLSGGPGNNTLIAGSGQDLIYGGADIDRITIGASNLGSTVYGNPGNDVIDASRSTHSNYLSGDNGDDSIVAGSGADTLLGGDGNDTLIAGSGHDQIYGGADNDSITIGALTLSSTVYGGKGNDVIDASASNQGNLLSGDLGNDTILTGKGGDTVYGGGGSDTIRATSGAVDTLHVGLANSSAVSAADATQLDHVLNFGAEDKLVFDGGVAGTTANTVFHGGDVAIANYAAAYAYAYGDATHAAAITGATQYAVVNDTAGHVYVFAANYAGVELDGLAGGISGITPGQFLGA